MPDRYYGIKRTVRARAKAQGKKLPEDKIETSAARIFNATRKPGEKPVTGPHKRKRK